MSGFDKIEFKKQDDKGVTPANSQINTIKPKGTQDFAKSKPAPIVMSQRKKKANFKFKFHKKLTIALGIIVILIVLISIPAYATYKSGLKTYREAKLIAAAAKEQNIDLASDEIAKTQTLLAQTQKDFHYLLPLKFIPIVSWYYNDADHLMSAGSDGLTSAQTIAMSLKPYAD